MRRKYEPPFPSSAPLAWNTEGSTSARLYRRLVAAVASARDAVVGAARTGVETDHLARAVTELQVQATAITEHLVILSRLPFAKRQRAILPFRGQVDDVEKLSARIGVSALRARGHEDPSEGLREISTRLGLLDEARGAAASELPETEGRQLSELLESARASSLAWMRTLREKGPGK